MAISRSNSSDDLSHLCKEIWSYDTIKAETASLLFAALLSLTSALENNRFSLSSRLAYFQSIFASARLGGNSGRITLNKEISPHAYSFIISESTLAFGLLALTNILEGNSLSFVLAASGTAASFAFTRDHLGDEKIKSMASDAIQFMSAAPGKLFNSALNLFRRNQHTPEVDTAALALKKNI